jgi:hypothetical protein
MLFKKNFGICLVVSKRFRIFVADKQQFKTIMNMDKIWIVLQESNVDGELIINATPCESLGLAKEVLKEEKEYILNESFHYSRMSDEDMKEMEIEETDTSYYINDPCDDYYEDIKIIEKNIVKKAPEPEEPVIKVGSKVVYKGAWGSDPEKEVEVVAIEKCENEGDKYGKRVSQIPWGEKNYGVFDVSDGHWCYGYQIVELKS